MRIPVVSMLRAALCLLLSARAVAPAQAGEMVLSQFVYRDINRNGIYDMGEPPVSGVPVRLTRAGQAPIRVATNLAGFANFVMSPEVGMIPAPGAIGMEVLPPDDMVLSETDGRHVTTIHSLPTAPGGLVAGETPPFVGLAPKLGLSIAARPGEAVTCISDGIEWAALGEGDTRYCPAGPGRWTVRWADGTEREIDLGDWPIRLPRPAPDMTGPPHGSPVTITFDDLITSNNLMEVPKGVGGMTWRNFVATHRMYYEGAGYINGTTSGEFAAYNSSGHTAVMSSDTPFDLREVKLTVAWPDGLTAPIRVEAYRNGRRVAQDRFYGSQFSPVVFAPDWVGIDELRILHEAYWQVVIDDIVISHGG